MPLSRRDIVLLALGPALAGAPGPAVAQGVGVDDRLRGGLREDAPALPKLRVAFLGDSMADGLWGAFVRLVGRDRCLKEPFEGGRFAKNGTGLTRLESYDWTEQARRIAESFHPALVVVSIGLNDRQDVVDRAGARAAYGTPAWNAAYLARVGELLRSAGSRGAAVLVVGLPAMREAVAARDAQEKNRLFAQAASGRARYVEPWHPAGSDPDTFRSAAPTEGGSLVQVRAPDGIHFTSVGYDLVMAGLFPRIVAALKASGREVPAACSGRGG